MKTSHILAAVILAIPCIAVLHGRALAGEVRAEKKPRVIATTDGEGDDRCSMVRFLMYANEWDIKGIIYSSSKYHWKGDGKNRGRTWHGETWIEEDIDKYAEVYPNLKKHDPCYPLTRYQRVMVEFSK